MLLPRLSTVAAALIALAVPASSRSEFQNLKVVDNFSKHFLFPNSLEQTRAINSTLFSEDVRGTVDGESLSAGRGEEAHWADWNAPTRPFGGHGHVAFRCRWQMTELFPRNALRPYIATTK